MAKEQDQTTLQNNINRICQSTEIVGNIVTPSDIRIDGLLTGNISAQGRIVIGVTGKIEGEVLCKNIDIWGTFEGKIVVSESLFLKGTGIIKGDIITNKLIVEPGAIFDGTCSMSNVTKEKEQEQEPEKEKTKSAKS